MILTCSFFFFFFFFGVVFVWFWQQGDGGLVELVCNCSFLCNFLKEFWKEKHCIILKYLIELSCEVISYWGFYFWEIFHHNFDVELVIGLFLI